MADQFPLKFYLEALVQLLDTIKYKDVNYEPKQRRLKMQIAYSAARTHFDQEHVGSAFHLSSKKLEASIRCIVGMVVFCWVKADLELTAFLTIFYTYFILHDDTRGVPDKEMETFVEDLMDGKPQKHPWWQLMQAALPKLVKHYGPFCALKAYRGTVDCELMCNMLVAFARLIQSFQSFRAAGLSRRTSEALQEYTNIRTICGH